jgi:Rrf2 family nitric oxide-sensitive transcriptional repressor
MYLASRHERSTAATVAQFYGISAAHVSKVVNQLSRLGYIRAVRGIGGGIELVRSADDISIGDVVTAFEGNLHLLECVGLDGVCAIESFCKLKRVLSEAERVQVDYLNGVSLAQVVPTNRQLARVAP